MLLCMALQALHPPASNSRMLRSYWQTSHSYSPHAEMAVIHVDAPVDKKHTLQACSISIVTRHDGDGLCAGVPSAWQNSSFASSVAQAESAVVANELKAPSRWQIAKAEALVHLWPPMVSLRATLSVHPRQLTCKAMLASLRRSSDTAPPW